MQRLRLTHPHLDFWVDVRLREFDGRWLSVVDLAGEPDVGTSGDPRAALRPALMALGPRLAEELAAGAEIDDQRDSRRARERTDGRVASAADNGEEPFALG